MKCRYILLCDVSWNGRLGKIKAVPMWYSQPKRPDFQIKSPVEKKKGPNHDGISVGLK